MSLINKVHFSATYNSFWLALQTDCRSFSRITDRSFSWIRDNAQNNPRKKLYYDLNYFTRSVFCDSIEICCDDP